MFSSNPYAGGYSQLPFNQEQMKAIHDIYVKIPLFGPNGEPMNKAAEELAKTIDCRNEKYDKIKDLNHRKTK